MKHASSGHPNKKAHNWLAYTTSDKLLERFRYHIVGTVYDLGCGEAPYKEYFLKSARKYVGVDWAASLHDTKADIVANLNEVLPIQDGVADTVVSLSVMEHLTQPDLMLCEAHRILKPGGSMILQVPWQWWVHEAPYDFFRYTPYALQHMYEKAGFVDIKVVPQSGYFTTAVLKQNYFTRRFVRGPRISRGIINALLIPLWTIGQLLAGPLDKLLDRRWELEAGGYFVVARRR
jgi:SAM-dependent methyltransferase